jgi:hypothetical protein
MWGNGHAFTCLRVGLVSTPIYEVATRQQKNGQFCAEAQITGAFCGFLISVEFMARQVTVHP